MNEKPDLEKHLIYGAAIVMIFIVVVALALVVGYAVFEPPLISPPMPRNIITNL